MEINSELRGMFSYSLLFFVLLFIIVLLIFIIMYKKKTPISKQVIIPLKKDLINLKNFYLAKLDDLSNRVSSNKITSRKAYQELSSLIRTFIYETTNINVLNYTLKEIQSINMPVLYDLVKEYYDPEFSVISKGNIISSINKTKVVISRWS